MQNYLGGCIEFKYNHLQMLTNNFHFMKQNADFQEGISQAQSTGGPPVTLIFEPAQKNSVRGIY